MTSGLDEEKTDADESFVRRMEVAARLAGNATKLAEKTGISRRAIGEYMAGKADPSRRRLIAIAKAAGLTVQWLADGDGPMHGSIPAVLPNRFGHTHRPVIGLAACGLEGWWQPAQMGLTTEVPMDTPIDAFGVIAIGESMIPAGINPGDLVIIDGNPAAQAVPGKPALYHLKGGEMALKVHDSHDGEWTVMRGWAYEDGGAPVAYTDRRKDVNRAMPVIEIRPGAGPLGAPQAAPARPYDPELIRRLTALAVSEAMDWLARHDKEPVPELTGEMSAIMLQMMMAPELDGADDQARLGMARRALDAVAPVTKPNFWSRFRT